MLETTRILPISTTPINFIEGWEEYQLNGEQYLKTAVGAYQRRRNVFTPEILYNIIAMAIEKFVMAALMRHGNLPYNHTIKDLVEAMEKTFPHSMDELREGLLALDKYQEICDLESYTIKPPSMEEIPGMLRLAEDLHLMVVNNLA